MRLALIDADILVYRVGFASDDSSEAIARSRMKEFVEDLLMLMVLIAMKDSSPVKVTIGQR